MTTIATTGTAEVRVPLRIPRRPRRPALAVIGYPGVTLAFAMHPCRMLWLVLLACTGACSGDGSAIGNSDARDDTGVIDRDSGTRPPFDASIYGDGAPWEDPSRISITQQVVGDRILEDDTIEVGDPLEGVTVCVEGFENRAPCARTDSEGWYTLEGLPKNAHLALELKKEPGYVPVIQPLSTRSDSIEANCNRCVLRMLPKPAVDLVAPAGTDLDERGAVLFAAMEDGESQDGESQDPFRSKPGVRVAIEPPAGERVYYAPGLVPDPDATASGAEGVGAFWGLPAGRYGLTFEHPDVGCEVFRWPANHLWGYETGRPDLVEAPVRAGHLTRTVSARCAVEAVLFADAETG